MSWQIRFVSMNDVPRDPAERERILLRAGFAANMYGGYFAQDLKLLAQVVNELCEQEGWEPFASDATAGVVTLRRNGAV